MASGITFNVQPSTIKTCDFLVPSDGKRIPCGEEATYSRRTPGGGVFYYCNEHADQAQRDLKRRGKTLLLQEVKSI